MSNIKPLAVVLLLTPCVAHAETRIMLPVQVGEETARYDHGEVTVTIERPDGAVEITPRPLDHGGISFDVAVFNSGKETAALDVVDVAVTIQGKPVEVYTRHQLEKKAENRAMWQQIGVGLVGALGAAAAASQRDEYRAKLVTPRGTYRYYASAPSTAGQVQATAIAAGTGVAIYSIQERLKETRAALGDQIIQMTSIEPGEGYAGRIVVAKFKGKAQPVQPVDVTVRWAGQDYRFGLQVAHPSVRGPKMKLTQARAAPLEAAVDRSAPESSRSTDEPAPPASSPAV